MVSLSAARGEHCGVVGGAASARRGGLHDDCPPGHGHDCYSAERYLGYSGTEFIDYNHISVYI